MPDRPAVGDLILRLGLAPHPEGGHYREVFRSAAHVQPLGDDRGARRALTSIDFVLAAGESSAWHRVASDEAWHLLEGGPLLLHLMPPALDALHHVLLAPLGGAAPLPAGTGTALAPPSPRHVVPAGWWQAAEPLGPHAWCAATVGPGFEFADFGFGRDDAAFVAALRELSPSLERLCR
jgi:predicted cupin superfamily sugar epimerase